MERDELLEILKEVRSGATPVEAAADALAERPFADLGYARVDTHRAVRCGFPEVIFCEGKRAEEVGAIAARLLEGADRLLATRAGEDAYAAVRQFAPEAVWHERARAITVDGAAVGCCSA